MRIKNLPPDAQESDYMTLLECLANQFQMLELLNILKEWIETGLSSSYVPPPAKKVYFIIRSLIVFSFFLSLFFIYYYYINYYFILLSSYLLN